MYKIEKTKYAFSIYDEKWNCISYNLRLQDFFLSFKEIEDFIFNYKWNNLVEDLKKFDKIQFEKEQEWNWLFFENDLEDLLEWKEIAIERKLIFLNWLNRKLQEKQKWKVILVGWTAVEFYTQSNVKSYDIDVIYHNLEFIYDILKDFWFKKEGRYLVNNKLDIYLESPSANLFSWWEPVEIYLEWWKTNILIISIEDCILDRLLQANSWEKECLDQAILMFCCNLQTIDKELLKEKVKQNNIEDFAKKNFDLLYNE